MLSLRELWDRRIVRILASCALAYSTYVAVVRLTIIHNASAQVTAAPFSAEMHTYSYAREKIGSLLSKLTLARRSDGTTVSIRSAGPVEKGWTARRIQYMDGRYTGVVDLIASSLHGSIATKELAGLKMRLTNPPKDCILDPSLQLAGYEQVFGRRLAKIVRVSPDSVFTAWHDPELGCEILQSLYERKETDGSLTLVSRKILVNISTNEPDQRLFDEPSFTNSVVATVRELEDRFGAAVEPTLRADQK